jgi:transketolase
MHLLDTTAKKIRISIVESLAEAGSGHLGGSLGLADIFTALYFNILSHNPKEPNWPVRDRLILSIGHVAPVLYASLAHAGYFPVEELNSLRKLGSRLQGHPGREHGLPGLELSAGSLGQGLSVSVGLALAARLNQANYRIYCVMGDGELQEGSVWEAAMSAAHHKLSNITAIVDRNYCQIDGNTSVVMEIEPLADKWKAFGWEVLHCNGNSITDFINCCNEAKSTPNKPIVIIATTFMGKGINAIENDYHWHGKAPSRQEAELFINELISNV